MIAREGYRVRLLIVITDNAYDVVDTMTVTYMSYDTTNYAAIFSHLNEPTSIRMRSK